MRGLAALAGAVALVGAAPPADDPFRNPVAAGYRPVDKDERGLWMQVDEVERQIKTSSFVIRDPALNAYLRSVFCRTVGDANCAGVRIYILRTADFNASMYPTGMMMVYSGLLLRMRDEAQLAAVLGHEYTHFTHRHTLQNFRDVRGKATALAWLSLVPATSYGMYAVLTAAQIGLIGSIFRFSREMESEADAGSIPLMTQAGYDPHEASRIWEQLRDEQDATAVARHRRSRKDSNGGIFGTHPPTKERVAALGALADATTIPAGATDGRAAYRAGLRTWWPTLVDDQIKLNDFGATDFLIDALARDEGWTPELLYARGELYRTRGRPDDLTQAAGFYRGATASAEAPAESWRGLGLVELRAGHDGEGKAALRTYLAKKPEASDGAMMAMLAGDAK